MSEMSDITASFFVESASPRSPSLVPRPSNHNAQFQSKAINYKAQSQPQSNQPQSKSINHYKSHQSITARPYTTQPFTHSQAFQRAGNRNPSTRRLFSAYSYMESPQSLNQSVTQSVVQKVSDNRMGVTSLRHRTTNQTISTNSVPTGNERMDHSKEFDWMPNPMVEADWRNVYRSKPDPKLMDHNVSHKRSQSDNQSVSQSTGSFDVNHAQTYKRESSSNHVPHSSAWRGAGGNKRLAPTDLPINSHLVDPFDASERANRYIHNHSIRTGHRVECDHPHNMKLGPVEVHSNPSGYRVNRMAADGRWTVQPNHGAKF